MDYIRWNNAVDPLTRSRTRGKQKDINCLSYAINKTQIETSLKRINTVKSTYAFVLMRDDDTAATKSDLWNDISMLSLSSPTTNTNTNTNDSGGNDNVYVCAYPQRLCGELKSSSKTMIKCGFQAAKLSSNMQQIIKNKGIDSRYVGIAYLGPTTCQMSGATAVASNDSQCKILATLASFRKIIPVANQNTAVVTIFQLRNDPVLCSEIGGNSEAITTYFEQEFGEELPFSKIKQPPNYTMFKKLLLTIGIYFVVVEVCKQVRQYLYIVRLHNQNRF